MKEREKQPEIKLSDLAYERLKFASKVHNLPLNLVLDMMIGDTISLGVTTFVDQSDDKKARRVFLWVHRN